MFVANLIKSGPFERKILHLQIQQKTNICLSSKRLEKIVFSIITDESSSANGYIFYISRLYQIECKMYVFVISTLTELLPLQEATQGKSLVLMG